MLETNKIYQGDCLEVMKELENNSIDLVVTSPPYDNLREYKGYKFDFEGIARELFRIIKDGGVVVWVIVDQTINGSETGTSFKHALYFKTIGFNLHDTMIYAKNNPIPCQHNRYQLCFEYMFILSKGKPKTFNPIKEKCVTFGKTRLTGQRNKKGDVTNSSSSKTTREFRYKHNIFYYNLGGGKSIHPAPFPEKLAEDHILSWSNQEDLVLDSICGSGTTCIMARKNGRRYIGIDISKEYVKIAQKRLSQENIK